MTNSPEIRPARDWDSWQRLDMARLIADSSTNGGLETGVSAEQLSAALPPDVQAWGVWLGGRPVFLAALMPYDGARGILHLAGTRTLSHAQHVQIVRAFLNCYPDTEISTVTRSPALARLARTVGMAEVSTVDGAHILRRVPA